MVLRELINQKRGCTKKWRTVPLSPFEFQPMITNEALEVYWEDLRSWLFKIEQFFSIENVPREEKIGVAALQLEGEAIQ